MPKLIDIFEWRRRLMPLKDRVTQERVQRQTMGDNRPFGLVLEEMIDRHFQEQIDEIKDRLGVKAEPPVEVKEGKINAS